MFFKWCLMLFNVFCLRLPTVVGCWLLVGVCCLLFVVCCLVFVVCCLLFVVCVRNVGTVPTG